MLYERTQAVPEECCQQLRHQHQADGGDPQRDGHLPRQESSPQTIKGKIHKAILY